MPTALITGASTGIGEATALRLAKAGWTVLAGVRDSVVGQRLASEVGEAAEGRLHPLLLDVTDSEQIAQAAARVHELADGRLDALVNNAGIGVGGPLELIPPEELRRQLEVNVIGQMAVTQALLPALRAARGRVVFLSSIGGRVSLAFTAPYAASKHAIEALGDALRVELATSHVQVALIEPGSVATPIWGKAQASEEELIVPPELEQEYGHVSAAMRKALADSAARGVPAERVAQTIERALTASRMKARYLVGTDARVLFTLKRLLPDHLFDRFVKRAVGV